MEPMRSGSRESVKEKGDSVRQKIKNPRIVTRRWPKSRSSLKMNLMYYLRNYFIKDVTPDLIRNPLPTGGQAQSTIEW